MRKRSQAQLSIGAELIPESTLASSPCFLEQLDGSSSVSGRDSRMLQESSVSPSLRGCGTLQPHQTGPTARRISCVNLPTGIYFGWTTYLRHESEQASERREVVSRTEVVTKGSAARIPAASVDSANRQVTDSQIIFPHARARPHGALQQLASPWSSRRHANDRGVAIYQRSLI